MGLVKLLITHLFYFQINFVILSSTLAPWGEIDSSLKKSDLCPLYDMLPLIQ